MKFELIEGKSAICVPPKCGTRTILGYRNYLKYLKYCKSEQPPIEWGDFKKNQIGKKVSGLDMDSFGKYEYRICVVRDPVKRFVSACTNFNMLPEYTDRIGGKKYSIRDVINVLEDPLIKFTNDTIHKEIYIHTCPQTDAMLCGANSDAYTHIFNTDQMALVRALMEEISNEKLPNFHNNKSTPEKVVPTSEDLEWIKNRYKSDYEIYGKWIE